MYRHPEGTVTLMWQGNISRPRVYDEDEKIDTHRLLYVRSEGRFASEILEKDLMGGERWIEYQQDEAVRRLLTHFMILVMSGKAQLPSL